jgi:lipoprotein-releasing system permease protein
VRVSFFIARRYFFSKKNPSAVNIITAISLAGYAVGSLAMIVLLSALNGFENSIFGDYQRSSPDFKIVASKGKVFEVHSKILHEITHTPGLEAYSLCLEDKAIVKFGNQQVVGVVRGVDSAVFKVYQVDSWTKAGTSQLQFNEELRGNAWLSEGLVYTLNVNNSDEPLELFTPDRTSSSLAQTTLNQEFLTISSMVHLSSDDNENTVIVPLWVARNLFSREEEVSAIHIKIKGSESSFRGKLEERLKPLGLKLLNRQEQNETMYRMFNTEKWFSFALLVFILLLISFNLYGALRMMRIDKKEDLHILGAMGMRALNIQNIFRWEGFLVSLTGTLIGLCVGIGLVWVQQRWGLVTTQATFELVYPVSLKWQDVVMVGLVCTGLGSLR